MSSEASADAARLDALDLRRQKLLARIASGAGLGSVISACGGGLDDDATLRAVIDEDTGRPGGAAARLRPLHAWPLVGAVDAFVTLADQTLSGRDPSHRLGAREPLSAYADVSGDGLLRITPKGRTDLVLFDSASIGLAAHQVATLAASPAPGAARVAVAVLPQGLPACLLANTVLASP